MNDLRGIRSAIVVVARTAWRAERLAELVGLGRDREQLEAIIARHDRERGAAFTDDYIAGRVASAREIADDPAGFAETSVDIEVENGRLDPSLREDAIRRSTLFLAGRHAEAARLIDIAHRHRWRAVPRPRARARRRRAIRRLARRATADPDPESRRRRASRRGGARC